MSRTLRLQVLTPSGPVLDREVDFLVLRTTQGEMGILPDHIPCAVMLDYGVLRAYEGKEQAGILAVLGGFATVRENRVTVLTALAEHPDHIEETLDRIARERAESAALDHRSEVEIQRAESALRRTLVQSGSSGYSLLMEEREGGTDS